MSKRLGIVIAVLLIAAIAAGCGGGKKNESQSSTAPASSGATQRIELIAKDAPFAYEPTVVEVSRGTTVELVLKNEGVLVHDVHIDEFNVKSDRIDPGKSSSVITFTANRVGEFKMYCAEPGHEAGGMVATLKVVS